MRRTIATLANVALNVIVDDVVLHSSFRDDYLRVLNGLNVLFVGVHCSLDEMNRRERMREGRFPGTAESTLAKVHQHMLYDVEVDATYKSPTELAHKVLRYSSRTESPNALERMQSLNANSIEHSDSSDPDK
jgi:chloramphenicol 3-O phosphotransferase